MDQFPVLRTAREFISGRKERFEREERKRLELEEKNRKIVLEKAILAITMEINNAESYPLTIIWLYGYGEECKENMKQWLESNGYSIEFKQTLSIFAEAKKHKWFIVDIIQNH